MQADRCRHREPSIVKKKIHHNGVYIGEFETTGDDLKDVVIVSRILDERGLNGGAVPLHVSIFQQAYSFSIAATQLFQRIVQKPPDVTAVSPFVVNITFSIELYLKSLALKHGKRLHGHPLGDLFKKVPAAGKAQIEQKLIEMAQSQWADGPKTIQDLRDTAKALNTAFIDWRYLFENPSKPLGIHFKQTIYLAEILHAACQTKDPPA